MFVVIAALAIRATRHTNLAFCSKHLHILGSMVLTPLSVAWLVTSEASLQENWWALWAQSRPIRSPNSILAFLYDSTMAMLGSLAMRASTSSQEGGGEGVASGKVARHFGRLSELPYKVPQSVASDEEPGWEVWKQAPIFQLLDPNHTR